MPAGTTLAQFSTFAADFAAGTDVDLFLYQAGTTNLVARAPAGRPRRRSGSPTRRPGSYDLYVVLFGVGAGADQHADRADVRLGAGRHGQGQPHRDPGQPAGDRGDGGHGHGGVERADGRLPLPRPDLVRRRHGHRGRHARPRRRLARTLTGGPHRARPGAAPRCVQPRRRTVGFAVP